MEFRGIVSDAFSASHVVKGHPTCGRLHGHRWRVSVEITTGQDPETGELVGLPELAAAVRQFCSELDREHVNDMLPASHATAAGINLALRERLSLDWRLTRIEVWADEVGALTA